MSPGLVILAGIAAIFVLGGGAILFGVIMDLGWWSRRKEPDNDFTGENLIDEPHRLPPEIEMWRRPGTPRRLP